MSYSAPELIIPSTQTRLANAVERLDEKLGSLEEWVSRTEQDLDDFQLRWQASSENIAAQLSRVEDGLTEEPATPHLRIF
jgi:predicted  nucleic acid-binding Zn-ribbon protein